MCASTEMFCSAVVSLRGSDFQTGKGTSQISAAYKAVQENQTILPLSCARCQQRSHQASIPHAAEPALLARKPPRTEACLGQEMGVLRKGGRFFHFWFVSVLHRDLCAFKHFSAFWKQCFSFQGQHFRFFHFPPLTFWVSALRFVSVVVYVCLFLLDFFVLF